MKLSIVIPSYNQQDFLPDCIESVLNQKVSADEIIVIDDGSTDHSLEIARKYPVKVISQVNKGLASARNTGIMNATGDYIFFLDSDDLLNEDCIEEVKKVISETNADVVSPSFKCFGNRQDEVILMPNPKIEDFKVGNRVGYCSAVKREVLLEVGGYNPKMIWGWEDYDLWFDLLERGKQIVTIPKILWLYRVKNVSMFTESKKHEGELWAQLKKNHPNIWPTLPA